MSLGGAVTTARFSERTRSLLSLVNIHWVVAGLLGAINLWLVLQLGLAWRAAGDHGAEVLAQQQVALRTAQLQARPLEGLDAKLAGSTSEADDFYQRRLPFAESQVYAELGSLARKQNVKLTRVQYAESPQLDGTAAALTEQRMDASLSGDYRGLVQFMNSLERDRMFFVITGISLSGQQSGTVGLRLRLSTYLRPPRGGEEVPAGPTELTAAGLSGPVASTQAVPEP